MTKDAPPSNGRNLTRATPAEKLERMMRARGLGQRDPQDALRQKYAGAIRKAQADMARDARERALQERFGHKRGTPETYAAIEAVPARRRQSAMSRMFQLGKISADELAAGMEIADVVEMIQRAVSVRCASLEARVDYAGSARDALVESLGRVRLELSYRVWRNRIPVPRAMILDMIVRDQSYVAVARKFGVPYRQARKRLITALRLWQDIRFAIRLEFDRESVLEAHRRLGEGVLTLPRPRPQQQDDENEGHQDG